MVTKVLKVVAQTDAVMVPSKKQESGQIAKCYIRLRELGGEYEGEYICTLFGELAQQEYASGKLVVASLRFQTHEANGAYYQDIVVNEIVPIN